MTAAATGTPASYQPFYTLTGGLIGTLLVALVVSGRFLAGSRTSDPQASRVFRAYRAGAAVLGVLAGIVGEGQVLTALLDGSPRRFVTPASTCLGALCATLLCTVGSEAAEALFLPRLTTTRRQVGTAVGLTLLAALAGLAWSFTVH